MANTELVGLAAELSKLKGLGHTAIAIEVLLRYVNGLADAASAKDPESERQESKLRFEAQVEGDMEMFKAVIEAGQSTLKVLSLVNGAAAIAILSFLGTILSKQDGVPTLLTVPLMRWAMLSFSLGVGLSALGFGFRYLSQGLYKRDFRLGIDSARKWGDTFRNLAILSAVASLLAFFAGIGTAFCAFSA